MKSCPLCGMELSDDATHCESDWTRLSVPPPPDEGPPTDELLQPLSFCVPSAWGAGYRTEPLGVGERYTLGLFIGIEGQQAGKAISIKPGATVFGSRVDASVFLFDTDVAPNHCEVRSDGQHFSIRDLGTESGVEINGERRDEHKLSVGDRVRIGSETFIFQTAENVVLNAWDLGPHKAPPPPPPAAPLQQAAPTPPPTVLDENTPLATLAIEPGDDPLSGRLLDGRFEVLERIGEGGTVVVYKAQEQATGERRALRILSAHVADDPSWADRFVNAAAAFAHLDHPVWIRSEQAVQTADGLIYQPMELVEGETLRAVLDRDGRLEPVLALYIAVEVCAALSEAHSLGILHRQLKPEKVILRGDPRRDGLSRSIRLLGTTVPKLDDPHVPKTASGIVYGTPVYMSPEQARGGLLGPRSDVYAMGVMLYEMLSGKPPFEAPTPMEVVMRHIKEPPPPLHDIPETLAAVVMKALAKDNNDRQHSTRQLAEDCWRVLDAMEGRTQS